MTGKRKIFIDTVVGKIKSKRVRPYIAKELEHHINEEKQRYLRKGMTEIEAEEHVVNQMGSPIQLSYHFNKIHRPRVDWWLVGLLVVTFCLSFLPILADSLQRYYIVKQYIYIGLGISTVIGFMLIDYTRFIKYKVLLYAIGVFLLMVLWLVPTYTINGLPYLKVGSFLVNSFHFLPFLFVSLVAFLYQKTIKLPQLSLMVVIPLILITLIGDLPTSLLYVTMAFTMICWSQVGKKKKVKLGLVMGVLITLQGIFYVLSHKGILLRVKGFLYPENFSSSNGYIYILIRDLLSSAGWLGNGKMTDMILPEAHTTLAFVSIAYNYGWLVAAFIFITLVLLLSRMIIVSKHIKDSFGRMLLIGGVSIFASQILYNIAMSFGLLPIISVGLPFISYGVLYNLINCMILGIVLSVFRRKDLFMEKTS
ncbi:FtsW/RodA/SpoVE family cell cycle protein [Radiobacillus kanasensis]|uniref:FtsW/RodA/SpoVE family cell cycle protein n=1 Tax=Radiobacillus kanasensis TaxID=2844358 RepID=UPI001E38D5B6|nr:FtsW/RodA/SpoVE family cell cycle protein [Radiobacillus kanasensis]UFT98413.1 FtsW/RodA/SpoVE family cell cycle protein [Radiobacillus kanasensis]